MARRSTVAGLAVMAVVLVLFSANLVWMLRNCEQLRPLTSGSVAPDFTLPRFGGGEERLAAHRGKVVLLGFWASWCHPCIRELPLLAELQRTHAPRGFMVLWINVEGDLERVKQVHDGHAEARELPLLVDRNREAASRYGVQTLPHLVVVGRDGQVAHVHVGAGGVDQLRAAIETALAQPQK